MSEFLRVSPHAIEVRDNFDYLSRAAEQERQKLIRITDFMASHGLVGRMHDGHGRRLALLDLPQATEVDPTTLDKYLAQRIEAERTGVDNRCFKIAHEAQAAGVATGILYGEGTRPLASWDDHRINYDILDDGTVVAVDLTTRENVLNRYDDDPQFHVLALRAEHKDLLIPQVAELYGGTWEEVSPARY